MNKDCQSQQTIDLYLKYSEKINNLEKRIIAIEEKNKMKQNFIKILCIFGGGLIAFFAEKFLK